MVRTLLSDSMLPFTIALAIVVGLLIVEVVSLLLGFALSDVVDVALDTDADLPDAVEWFGIGHVPVMILLPMFLGGFGFTGFVIQSATGGTLSPWIAAIPALIGALALTRFGGRALGNFFTRDETTAVTAESLIGHTAVITLGATRFGEPSQAKLRDPHGQMHYVLVEPVREGDSFDNGERVILVRRDGPKYYVVADDPEAILSLDAHDLAADVRQGAKHK
ncbi:DUF1449 family protein [bacterium]|nr:MAG: DUF1449 family protein [bacterium]